MKKSIWNVPATFYILGASFMLVMAFTIVEKNIDGMGMKTIFIGSIITTGAAAMSPLFSLNCFKLNSYEIKTFSILVGLVLGLVSIFLFTIDNTGIEELFDYSSKGLLWVINISLLLFNLATLEVENNEVKMRKAEERFIEMEKQLIEKDRELIRRNEEFANYLEQMINNEKGNSKSNE